MKFINLLLGEDSCSVAKSAILPDGKCKSAAIHLPGLALADLKPPGHSIAARFGKKA